MNVIAENLNRIESLLSAFNDALSSEWSRDYITAYGWSGRRNPAGWGLIELYRDYNQANFFLIRNALSRVLESMNRFRSADCFDGATDALHYIYDGNCQACHGTGVIDIHQQQCPFCAGTGKISRPSSQAAKEAIGFILDKLIWMNGQMSAKLAGTSDQPASKHYTLHLETPPASIDEISGG